MRTSESIRGSSLLVRCILVLLPYSVPQPAKRLRHSTLFLPARKAKKKQTRGDLRAADATTSILDVAQARLGTYVGALPALWPKLERQAPYEAAHALERRLQPFISIPPTQSNTSYHFLELRKRSPRGQWNAAPAAFMVACSADGASAPSTSQVDPRAAPARPLEPPKPKPRRSSWHSQWQRQPRHLEKAGGRGVPAGQTRGEPPGRGATPCFRHSRRWICTCLSRCNVSSMWLRDVSPVRLTSTENGSIGHLDMAIASLGFVHLVGLFHLRKELKGSLPLMPWPAISIIVSKYLP